MNTCHTSSADIDASHLPLVSAPHPHPSFTAFSAVPDPCTLLAFLPSSLGGFHWWGAHDIKWNASEIIHCLREDLIFIPTATDKEEVVLPRGLDITWTSRGKLRATAAHYICIRQEGKAQRKCCPSIPRIQMDNQYENGTRRQRLFTLFSYFSCYKEGQWNSDIWR